MVTKFLSFRDFSFACTAKKILIAGIITLLIVFLMFPDQILDAFHLNFEYFNLYSSDIIGFTFLIFVPLAIMIIAGDLVLYLRIRFIFAFLLFPLTIATFVVTEPLFFPFCYDCGEATLESAFVFAIGLLFSVIVSLIYAVHIFLRKKAIA